MIRLGAHFNSKPQCASLRFCRGMGLVVAREVRELLDNPYTPHAFPPSLEAASQSVSIKNANLRTLGELCLRLTTARDIIWHLGYSRVVFEHELARAIEKIPWPAILPEGSKLALRISCAESRLYHSGLIAEAAGKSLASVGIAVDKRENTITTLELSLRANSLSLGLSLAGAPLNRRGFRCNLSHNAPLNECLAASVLRFAHQAVSELAPELSNAIPQIDVPFAGSGTFGFEALMKFGRIAPCIFRNNYAAEQLHCTAQASLAHTRKRAAQSIACQDIKLYFTDIDHALCNQQQVHSNNLLAGLKQLKLGEPLIKITVADFFSLPQAADSSSPNCLLLNPPYGERLQVGRNFFSALGEKVVEIYRHRSKPTWGVALLPAGQASLKFSSAMGKRVFKKISLRNGGIAVNALVFLIR